MELMRIGKLLEPIKRRMRSMITRGVVTLVHPARLLQELQVAALGDQLLDNIEHWEPYGFTSRPHPGAEALLLSVGADRDHSVAVSVADRRFRLRSLEGGEVAISTDEGDVIHFKRGNQILIDTAGTLIANAGTSATVTAPTVTINGNTTINGTLFVSQTIAADGNISSAAELSDSVGTMSGVRTIYNSHDHTDSMGGTTLTPNQSM